MRKIGIIIPAFNEEASIENVVRELQALPEAKDWQIDPIVVNDCSGDRTSSIAHGLNCRVIDLPVNLGIGGAVQTGFRYLRDNDYDFGVQVDGDGQHPASEVPRIIAALDSGMHDIVIGSRFLGGKGFQSHWMRRIGIRVFQSALKALLDVSITDSTSGLRGYSRASIAAACEFYPDEYPEVEAIVIFSCLNFRICEIPVEMRERQGGRSSIGFFSSFYYMAKVFIAMHFTYLRFRSLRHH